MREEDDSYVIYTAPQDLDSVRKHIETDARVVIQSAELDQTPKTTVSVQGEEAEKILRLLEALDEHDDVTKVYSNFDIPDVEA